MTERDYSLPEFTSDMLLPRDRRLKNRNLGRYLQAINQFRSFITTDEVLPDRLIIGWRYYREIGIFAPFSPINHIQQAYVTEVVRVVTQVPDVDPIKASLGLNIFALETFRPLPPRNRGYLLEGLIEQHLERALSFCVDMHSVGEDGIEDITST